MFEDYENIIFKKKGVRRDFIEQLKSQKLPNRPSVWIIALTIVKLTAEETRNST